MSPRQMNIEWPIAVGSAPAFRHILMTLVLAVTGVMIVGPLVVILVHAFSAGIEIYLSNLVDEAMLHAIGLTVLAALVVVPINIVFGIAAAWAVTKFDFPDRRLLITLIELPYSISPIVAGVSYLFVYGAQGWFGPTLQAAGIQIMFALPAIFLASMFVTAPFVARVLIPLMQVQGVTDEEAALSLGASGFSTFMRVTLPNIRWALIYGAIVCNARVMGEFGAVSVVSGSVRGATNTLPLQIDLLYQDYNAVGAFVAASLLMLVALLTIIVKVLLDWSLSGGSEEFDRTHH